MAATRSSGKTEGCWTCKLRRKRCDARQPTCGICDSLEIACIYGPKPTWMHSGQQQRQMIGIIKNDIKRNAAYRREKGKASGKIAHNSDVHTFNVIPNMVASNNFFSMEPTNDTTSGEQTLNSESDATASHGSTPFALLPCGHQQHRCSSSEEQPWLLETDFIMKYFDFVFPILFPFYRAGLFGTGRSWLLVLLGKSRIAYHSTFSVASYFFTLALTEADIGGEFGICKQLRWEELEQQTDKCFDSIRTDMLALGLNSRSATATMLEKVEMMESVIQVLIFETALGRSSPCNSHLAAAFALFEDIMIDSGPTDQERSHSKLYSALLELGGPLWTRPGYSQHIWSPYQAGLRFSAGLLVFIDAVASTARQEPPRLLEYHADILARLDDGVSVVSDAEVRLSNIVGCRNWAIRSIAEISALASWKGEQSKANSLSVVELVNRASAISGDLKKSILETQNYHIDTSSSVKHRPPFDLHPSPSATFTSTLVWAYAAQLYLSVVVSGWQLSSTDVRANVTQIIGLLQDVPRHQLRALAWPVCVAGCLALEAEESSFLALFSDLGKVYTAGALNDVRQIWERVWQTRTSLHASTWDLASCFSILGSPVLLV